ncbi:tRNA pseudouridine(55) synthase TruB [Balneolales bacterium ANBcel1]|nr:tRNA pseudouridine(55) synthase TruB [Balneolales bacterium ANBcel1]
MEMQTDPTSRFPVYDRNNMPSPGSDHSEGAIFLLDKPSGWSSFDIVKFVRGRIRTKKTGHAGTLDPLATGLLILCAGKATKSISRFQDYPKRYRATVAFGSSTPSQDAATQPDGHAPFEHISSDRIAEVLADRLTGTIRQLPPMYSALWKDGKRLYTYARKGEEVEREPREVTVHEARIISWEAGVLGLDVLCSKGTYVRTLAHDLGLALDSRAHLADLRRTDIGPHSVDHAISVEEMRERFRDQS